MIMGTVTTALGNKWHPECFQCASCNQPITDNSFVALGHVPYHSSCDPRMAVDGVWCVWSVDCYGGACASDVVVLAAMVVVGV